jgi:hypothetical protein
MGGLFLATVRLAFADAPPVGEKSPEVDVSGHQTNFDHLKELDARASTI